MAYESIYKLFLIEKVLSAKYQSEVKLKPGDILSLLQSHKDKQENDSGEIQNSPSKVKKVKNDI